MSTPPSLQRFSVSSLTASLTSSKDNYIFGVVSVDAQRHERAPVLPVAGRMARALPKIDTAMPTKLADRLVDYLPMRQLWTTAEILHGSRLTYASAAEVAELLRVGTVFFMVADVGHPLHWIEEAQRFDFWKNEGWPHLADSVESIKSETFPDGFAYIASIWSGTDTAPIVLLEKYHQPLEKLA